MKYAVQQIDKHSASKSFPLCMKLACLSTKYGKGLMVGHYTRLMSVAWWVGVWLCQISGTGVNAQTTVVQGEYEVFRYERHSANYQKHRQVKFEARIAGVTYAIAATNLTNPKEWEILAYDGTNITALSPIRSVGWRELPVKDNLTFASISPSPFYEGLVQSPVMIHAPWLAYGVSPSSLNPNSNGLFDIPPPWKLPRRYLSAYGYKWLIKPTPDGRFIKSLEVVRDTSLDLDDESSEFLRFGFDPPDTLPEYEDQLEQLNLRKEVRNGFVDFSYSLVDFEEISGTQIPKTVTMEKYYHQNDGTSLPYERINLRVTALSSSNASTSLGGASKLPLFVQDYRYRLSEDGRVFRFVEYTLEEAQSWKAADDPDLLLLANRGFKAANKVGDFGLAGKWHRLPENKKKFYLLIILVGVQVPFLIIAWRCRQKWKKRNT